MSGFFRDIAGVFLKIKQLFCKHDWEICRQNSTFFCISGERFYKRCKKCGKVVEYIYLEFEGAGYR